MRVEDGGDAQWEGWKGVGERREHARKKKGVAGGRTSKIVTLDTSHSLRGWLKDVARLKSCYAERGSREERGERREVRGER